MSSSLWLLPSDVIQAGAEALTSEQRSADGRSTARQSEAPQTKADMVSTQIDEGRE